MKIMKKNNRIVLLIIMLLAQFLITSSVSAASFTLGTKGGTTDPNSRIVNDKRTLTISGVEEMTF